MPAALALRGAGLQPLTLEAKEGLALINGTQLSTALAALACADARAAVGGAIAAAALSTEVLLGSFQPARPEVQSAAALPGARERRGGCSRYSRGQRAGRLARRLRPRAGRLQPALRAAGDGRVVGRASSTSSAARDRVQQRERQPARVRRRRRGDLGRAVPRAAGRAGGRLLKIAVAEIASLSERRIDRLLDDARLRAAGRRSRARPGLESGYMLAQYTAAALVSENKVLAHPASVDSIPDRRRHRGPRQHGADRRRATRAPWSRTPRASWRSSCCARAARSSSAVRSPPGSARSGSTARCGGSCPTPEGDRPLSRAVRDRRALGAVAGARASGRRGADPVSVTAAARVVRAPRGTEPSCRRAGRRRPRCACS